MHVLLRRVVERLILSKADKVIVANPAIKETLESRHQVGEKICEVSQGYDEEDFASLTSKKPEIFVIGYLGTFSPDCDPQPFLAALCDLIGAGVIPKDKIRFVHVGVCVGIDLARLTRKYQLTEVVGERGYLSHRESLSEMKRASLLLVVTSDHPSVFPAKVFEYFRLRKPILGIVPPGSQIEKLLTEMGIARVVSPENKQAIKEAVQGCFSDFLKGTPSMHVDQDGLRKYERRSLSQELVSHFNQVAAGQC